MKAVATAQRTTVADVSRNGPTGAAHRRQRSPGGPIAASRQPVHNRGRSRKAPKRKLASTARRTGKERQPPKLPQADRRRTGGRGRRSSRAREARGRAPVAWLKLGGCGELASDWTRPVVSFVRKFPVIPSAEKPMKEQDARKARPAGPLSAIRDFFTAVRVARSQDVERGQGDESMRIRVALGSLIVGLMMVIVIGLSPRAARPPPTKDSRAIGSDFTTTRTSTIRRTFSGRCSTTTCTTAIRRPARFPCTTRLGITFTPSRTRGTRGTRSFSTSFKREARPAITRAG